MKAARWPHTDCFREIDINLCSTGREAGSQISPEAVSQVNGPWGANSINTGKVVLSLSKLTVAHIPRVSSWTRQMCWLRKSLI